MPQPLTERDLPKIRKEMQRILKKKLPFVREDVSADEARRRIQASLTLSAVKRGSRGEPPLLPLMAPLVCAPAGSGRTLQA